MNTTVEHSTEKENPKPLPPIKFHDLLMSLFRNDGSAPRQKKTAAKTKKAPAHRSKS